MEFKYEKQMIEPTSRWLRNQGLMIKNEFPTPWGICDLVGCSLNKNKVKHRLRLKQTRAIGSQLRVHLLSLIPDKNHHKSINLKELHGHFGKFLDPERVEKEVARLTRDRFVQKTESGSYIKVNGWLPLHKRLVAVELKLSRVNDAFLQAVNNLGFADESYVALPTERAKLLVRGKSRNAFEDKGIGVVAVGVSECRVLLKSAPKHASSEQITQVYSVDRFWNSHLKNNEA
jgi:hypothetical protein